MSGSLGGLGGSGKAGDVAACCLNKYSEMATAAIAARYISVDIMVTCACSWHDVTIYTHEKESELGESEKRLALGASGYISHITVHVQAAVRRRSDGIACSSVNFTGAKHSVPAMRSYSRANIVQLTFRKAAAPLGPTPADRV